ncbi:MAG: ornithine cyclodeaminase [Pseudomonadota bacterium]
MTQLRVVTGAEVQQALAWRPLIDALREGHRAPQPVMGDVLLEPGGADAGKRVLHRAVWIEGMGGGIKSVTIFPDNPAATPPRPAVQGQMMVFDRESGAVSAIVDGAAITGWKTAADSALGAEMLARADAETLLMIGAGAMAEPLIAAHRTVRPSLSRVLCWNRTPERADALAATLRNAGDSAADPQLREISAVTDLAAAAREADIISCATMSATPVLHGAWVQPGTHVDLVGAFTPAMREADNELLSKARLFVDSRVTAIHDIGELAQPIAAGVIGEGAILSDHYERVQSSGAGRGSAEDITVFKNGGGAHLDLMTALHLLDRLAGS